MKYKDYYNILAVNRDANKDEIKKAYRRLARKYHPDVSKDPHAETRFKELGEAYEVLKDPDKRTAYDRLGANWKAGQDFRPPPGWQDIFGGVSAGFSGSGFSDFFDSLFGDRDGWGRARPGAGEAFRPKGADQQASIEIDLVDAYRGARKSLRLDSGRKLEVKVPAGVIQGQRIRLVDQAFPHWGGGRPGDLYLEVKIRPHARFRLEARDVYLDVPITPWEAALGARMHIPTLGGRVDIKVPAGSTSGRTLRLKGRGLPGRPAGSQYVVLHIATPPADSADAREFYQRMQQELPFNPRAGF
jgi:curved DNA-binding protein